MGKARSKTYSGKKNPHWKGGQITIACEICGKKFQVFMSQIKSGRKYCSVACMGKARSKNYSGEKSPGWKGGPVTMVCEICDKEFQIFMSKIKEGRGKYCSLACMGIGYSGEGSPGWKTKVAKSSR
jgi:hypothetical protein